MCYGFRHIKEDGQYSTCRWGRKVTQSRTGLPTPQVHLPRCVHSLGSPSCLLAGFPAGKIASKDKEFPANLNDWNAIFFNDSAEMPDRKPCEFGGGGNVQKHLRSSWVGCRSLSQYHSVSSLSTRFMHLAFQCANPSERVMTGRKPKTISIWLPQGCRGCHFSDE